MLRDHLELTENEIINIDDDFSLSGLTSTFDFDRIIKECEASEITEEMLNSLYEDNISLGFANMRIIYGNGVIGISPENAPENISFKIDYIDGKEIVVPDNRTVVVMDTEDGDDDPDTNNFWFIQAR